MAEILTKEGSPEVSAIIVTTPVQITAYGLKSGDCVTFLKIQYTADRNNWQRNGCSVLSPSEIKVGRAEEYKIGTCAPSLSKCRNSIVINKPGIYQPNMKGVKTTDVVIEAEELDTACCPGPAELGIDPCGCACHGDPTEPLPILEEGCGGPSFVKMAWMYSPYDDRDPEATVSVTNCDGEVIGYVYPEAGDGHTVPVKACTENGVKVIGFAANNSASAAQMVAYQPDAGCGCSGGNGQQSSEASGSVNIVNETVKIADVFGDIIKG